MSAFGSCKRDKQGCLVSTEPGTSSEQMVHIGGTGGQQEVGKKAVPKNPSERKWREAQLCRVQVRPSHHAPYGHTKPCQGMATGIHSICKSWFSAQREGKFWVSRFKDVCTPLIPE